MKKIVLLILGLSLAACQAAVLQKVLLKDPAALCLDGSPGAYYVLKGKVPQKIILNFEGGGWCGSGDLASTTQSCYQRSKTALGSSKNYTETITFTQGILSNNVQNQFNQATKVHLKYCDGSGHQGSRKNPLSYKGQNLYFRGHNITIAQLDDLDKTLGLFSKATDIVVTGESAGGLATFLWTNYIKEKSKAKNIYSVPDSGIFLDSARYNSTVHSYRNGFINLFKISNVQIDPPVPECVAANKNQRESCMFAEQLYKYIKVPLFPIQSLYDTWSVANILYISCINGGSLQNCVQSQRNYIEEYRKNTTRLLQKIGSLSTRNGYWAPSCAIHTFIAGSNFYSPSYRVPMNSQFSIDHSLLTWITDQKSAHHHIDQLPWPYNKPCSGVKALRMQIQ